MTTNNAPTTLRPFVETLQAGDPIGHANLTLVPLRGGRHGPLDYILAAEAITAGTLTVTEVSDSGSVPELLAGNLGDRLILLLDGEELVGAKQNRILNTSLLLPARSKTKIPVSCVEQGRWRHVSQEFVPGAHSPSKLRARKSRDVGRSLRQDGVAASDQSAVWAEVSFSVAASGVASPTMALHDVCQQSQDLLGAYVDALKYPDGACGVVAAINGRLAAVDLFDKPATLGQVWPRLVAGYAMDAAARAKESDGGKVFTAKGASALLEHVGEVACQPCPSAGLGQDWRFEAPDVVGQALVVDPPITNPPDSAGPDRLCIHLSVFPTEGLDNDSARQPGIQPPSRRRLGRRPSRPDDEVVY